MSKNKKETTFYDGLRRAQMSAAVCFTPEEEQKVILDLEPLLNRTLDNNRELMDSAKVEQILSVQDFSRSLDSEESERTISNPELDLSAKKLRENTNKMKAEDYYLSPSLFSLLANKSTN